MSKLFINSFGYKFGVPLNADFVFDVRCLPNPYWEDTLRDKNGIDNEVQSYVFKDINSIKYYQQVRNLIASYVDLSNKDTINIFVGCTGGKHRSVAFAERLYLDFSRAGIDCIINHREKDSNW